MTTEEIKAAMRSCRVLPTERQLAMLRKLKAPPEEVQTYDKKEADRAIRLLLADKKRRQKEERLKHPPRKRGRPPKKIVLEPQLV